MQNAKDTFYVTLQGRLAALNPARTMVLRGVTRPGVMVEENELTSAYDPTDVFNLRWSALRVDARGALPLVAMQCEIGYCTDGNAGKMNFAGSGVGVAAATMGTNVFWGDAVFGEVTVDGERLKRVATVEVWAYQEAGEL